MLKAGFAGPWVGLLSGSDGGGAAPAGDGFDAAGWACGAFVGSLFALLGGAGAAAVAFSAELATMLDAAFDAEVAAALDASSVALDELGSDVDRCPASDALMLDARPLSFGMLKLARPRSSV